VIDLTQGGVALQKALNNVMTEVSKGAFQFDVTPGDLRSLSRSIEVSTDRLPMGLIIASMMIGSSLVLNAPVIAGMVPVVPMPPSPYIRRGE